MAKLAYLIGSGISINAGMPSTSYITKEILSEKKGDNKRIIEFLRKLKTVCDLYYLDQTERWTNYEDLYYLVEAIQNSELMKDDPAIQSLKESILPSLASSLSEGQEKSQLSTLAADTLGYIKKRVHGLLATKPELIDYLDNLFCLWGSQYAGGFSQVDIYTLNHDCVLESYFKTRNVKIIDGFQDPDKDGLRRMDFNLFDRNVSTKGEKQVRLLKLHGSIDWFRYDTDGTESERISTLCVSDDTSISKKDKSGKFLTPSEYPEFLIGTRNKFYDYTQEIYENLHRRFWNYLRCADHLIICGYGFGDRIINRYIERWHRISKDRRITIIYDKPDRLKRFVIGAIRGILNDRTDFIPTKIEQMSDDDRKEFLKRIT